MNQDQNQNASNLRQVKDTKQKQYATITSQQAIKYGNTNAIKSFQQISVHNQDIHSQKSIPNNQNAKQNKFKVFEDENYKKNESNQALFYKTMLKYQQSLPKQQLQQYKRQIQNFKDVKKYVQIGSILYLGYLAISQDRVWFKLTSSGMSNALRLFSLIIIPNIIINKKTDRTHQSFYQRNRTFLQDVLSEDDKKLIEQVQFISSTSAAS